FNSDCFGSPKIDDQLVFGRKLHRQIGGLLSFQNAVDIVRRTSVQVDIISAIGREPAICWVLAKCVQVWQPVLCGK
ncbi:MAG: hypothetical protein WAN52_03495, partial [Pseudolabrys sp.]